MYCYCGRIFSDEEIKRICQIISEDPYLNRAKLSRQVCTEFNWRKTDGGLKDMSCRVALIRMEKDSLITLPRPICKVGPSHIPITSQTDPEFPIHQPVHEFGSVYLELVKTSKQSKLWNEYIHRYHYLGHKTLPGAQLRYFVQSDGRYLALLGFGASAWQIAPRDTFIGWNHEQRKKNLHLIVNNSRFLVLPWIRSKNLASKILSLAVKQLPSDWQKEYAYSPVLVETFVEATRFLGTCYRAANWVYVGQTKGRGKLGPAKKLSVPIKDIWLYPLNRHFKRILIT